MQKKIVLTIITILAIPAIVYAQSVDLSGFVRGVLDYINLIIPLLVLMSLLAFFWNGANFIRKTGNGNELEEAKEQLWWSVIAFFVMISFWGIVQFLTADFFGESPAFGAPQLDINTINEQFPASQK